MKNFIQKTSFLAALLLTFFSAQAQCYNISALESVAASSNPGSALNTLSVCTSYRFTYTITNNSLATVNDNITINLPNGITYNSLVSVTGAVGSYLSGTASPVFSLTGWATGTSVTLVFDCLSPACGLVATTSAVTTLSGTTSCNTYAINNNLAIVPPTLSVVNNDGSGPLLKNIGDVAELVFRIQNVSTNGAAIPQINMTPNPDPTITFLGNYYISTSPTAAPGNNIYTYAYPTALPGTVSANTAIGAGITLNSTDWNYFFGTTGLDPAAIVYVHIPYRVSACGAAGGTYNFTWGCGSTVCNSATVNSNVGLVTGNPNIVVSSYPLVGDATFCSTAGAPTSSVFGFEYRNSGTAILGAPAGNAKATNIKLYIYEDTLFGALDMSTLTLYSGLNALILPAGFVATSTFVGSGGRTFRLHTFDFSAFSVAAAGSWNPLGTNSLSDLDGDGFVDDMAETATFTIQANFDYNTTTCPLNTTISNGYNMIATQLKYNNQCFSIPVTDVRQTPFNQGNNIAGTYTYTGVTGTSTLTLPSDILEGIGNGFDAAICAGTYLERYQPAAFDFNCPNGYHQIRLNIPDGFHLDPTGLTQVSPGTAGVNSALYQLPSLVAASRCGTGSATIIPTIQEICQNGSIPTHIEVRFGRLPNSTACSAGFMETYILPCLNLPLYMDCSGTLADCATIPANFGFDNMNYVFEYVCDETCETCSSKIAGASARTYHHCNGACDSYFSTENSFTFLRNTLGSNNANPIIDCNTPGLTLTNTSPTVIDLSSAYPGDVIAVNANGIFSGTHTGFPVHTGANYSNMYLQVRHENITPVASRADFRLFDLDLSQGGITITNTNTSATYFEPAASIIYTTTLVGTEVQMNFNLSAAGRAFINSATDVFNFDADIFLIARATPNVVGFTTFYKAGYYPLSSLRAEYMGTRTNLTTIDLSCDSWGSSFTMLQPWDIPVFPVNPMNNNCSLYSANCSFRTRSAKFAYQNDFPNEFRAYAELSPNVTIKIPPGYSYTLGNSVYSRSLRVFSATGTNNFPTTSTTVNIPITGETATVDAFGYTIIQFSGLSGPGSCWPLNDMESYSEYSAITVKMQAECDAPAVDTLKYSGSYTEGIQQNNPLYRISSTFNTKVAVKHFNPVLSVIPPTATVNAFTNNLVFDFGICNTNVAPANQGWVALENSMVNALNLSSAVITPLPSGAALPTATYIDGNGDTALMVYVGLIPINTCKQYRITTTVNANGCVAAGLGPQSDFLTVKFGNACNGILPTNPAIECQQGMVQFPFLRYPSDLQLIEPANAFPSAAVDLCNGSLEYNLIISSSEIGAVSNPSFWMNLPTGITLQDITFKYPCGSGSSVIRTVPDATTFGSGTSPGWNLNTHFLSSIGTFGLTGTTTAPFNQVCVKIRLLTSCSYNATDYVTFYTGGTSSCSQILTEGPVQHRPTINNALPLDNLSVSWGLTTDNGTPNLSCTNTGVFAVTVNNNGTSSNLHNSTLTATVPGAPFIVNPGSGTLIGTTITWNIPAGTIPAGASQSYTYSVTMGNALYCDSNINLTASVGFNETVSCTASGGSCAFNYTTQPATFEFDACCETPPCQVNANFDFVIKDCTLNFNDLSTGTSAINNWLWQFYDAGGALIGTSTSQNPSFTFPGSGNYSVCLTASIVGEGQTCEATYCTDLKFECKPCEVKPNFEFKIDNCTAYFTDLSTASGTIYQWQWDFYDAGGILVGSSTTQNPSFVFPASGTYKVCLTAWAYTETDKCKETYCTEINVDCKIPCEVKPNFEFKIDNCTAYFTDLSTASGTIYQWQWDFYDAGGTLVGSSTTQNPSFVFPASGAYKVCLTVWAYTETDKCKETYCTEIIVDCKKPCEVKPNFEFKIDNCTAYFTDLSTASGTIYQWQWDFYDAGGTLVGSSTTQNPSFVFPASGAYKVCLTVWAYTETYKCKETYCTEIIVDCKKPCEVKPNFEFKIDNCTAYFTDLSTASGTIYQWQWDFYDAGGTLVGSSTTQNPSFVFPASGAYKVCLTVWAYTETDKCKETYCTEIIVDCKKPCEVKPNFEFKIDNCTAYFTDLSTASGTIYQWQWDFYDAGGTLVGSSSTQNTSFVFPASGAYKVCLTVWADTGTDKCKETYCTEIIVDCKKPCEVKPNFEFKIDNCTAYFTDLSTASGTIYQWQWDFYDAGGTLVGSSTTQNPSFVFPASGTYKVCLTVSAFTTDTKCKETYCTEIKIDCNPCVITPDFSYSLDNCTVNFTDLSTASGTMVAWTWLFYNSSGTMIGNSTVQNPSFTFPSPGTYKVCLTVGANSGDIFCKEKICKEISFECKPCTLVANYNFQVHKCKVSFAGAASTTGTVTAWWWTFGDGTTSTLQNPIHVYPGSGTYTACLTVTSLENGISCSDTQCYTFTLTCPSQEPCIVTAGFNFSGTLGTKTRNFTNLSSTTGTITSWAWNFGDPSSLSNTSTLQNPTHTFTNFGTYTVCLIVTAIKGGQTCTDTICKKVTVKKIIFNPNDLPNKMVAFPNPTSQETTISLLLVEKSSANIGVYNMFGELIQTLYQGTIDANVTLDLKWDASKVNPGVYIIKADLGTEVLQERVVVTK